MTATATTAAALGVTGLAVGSLLTTLIHRVPRQQSVVSPGSYCPGCAASLKARHLVPLLSWIVLRGRCAAGGCRISARYPLVEVGTGVLFAAVTVRFGLSVQLPPYLYLAAVGLALALIDFDVRRLPDTIVLPSYVIVVLLLLPAGAGRTDGAVAARSLGGMVALLALFFALALAYPNGLGFGDVKFAGLIGLLLGWLSWNALFIAAAGSFVIAAVGGLAVVATRHGTRHLAVPVGPCLISSAVLTLFVAAPISSWYGSLLTV